MTPEQYLDHLILVSRDAFGAGVQTHHLNKLAELMQQAKSAPAPAQSTRNDYR